MYLTKEIADRIKMRLSSQDKKTKDMLSELGMGINTISEFSKGKHLSCISLARIADFLDCSVDYLLGRTDVPEVNHRSGSIMPTAEHGTIAAFGGGVHMAPDDDEPITTLPKSR